MVLQIVTVMYMYTKLETLTSQKYSFNIQVFDKGQN